MNITHINTADIGGGAEGSARKLVEELNRMGNHATLVVGQKFTDDRHVLEIPRSSPLITTPILALSNRLRPYVRRVPGLYPLTRTLDRLANPTRLWQFLRGLDETPYPQACRNIPNLTPYKPDIIHCHNLHGWYFDLNALPLLAQTAPVIINLRDSWLLTGHCAYPLDGDGWKNGCGNCPNLKAYPRCFRDSTRQNLCHKAQIVRQSHAYLTAPSRWQASLVEQSVLKDIPCQVVPNGIDTAIFRPGLQSEARRQLGLPPDAFIIMFATAAKTSAFKDIDTLWQAAANLSLLKPDVHFLCVGSAPPPSNLRFPHLHYVSYVAEPQRMALHYQAADLFWHAAHAETFGKTVTEAMACGTPPIATDIGGIPEQILDGQTGFLARYRTPRDFVEISLQFMNATPDRRQAWRQQAASHGAHYSLQHQARLFVRWYQEILRNWKRPTIRNAQ